MSKGLHSFGGVVAGPAALGSAMLVVEMAIIAASLHLSSPALLIFGAVVAGVGQGISFNRGLAAVAVRLGRS